MTRTFLVALTLEPSSDVDSIAADILDSLALDGFQVTSVKPWASSLTDQADELVNNFINPQSSLNFLG